jgi:hypothetical protein
MQVLFTECTRLNNPGILLRLHRGSFPQGNSHFLIAADESAATAQSELRKDAFLALAGTLVENSETLCASLWQRRSTPLIRCTPRKRAATPQRLIV